MENRNISDFIITNGATLLEAAKVIESNASRTVLVVDDYESKKVLGVLSEGDILRALIKGADVHSSINGYVRSGFSYLQKADMKKAMELFSERGFALLPVVDADMRLKSVITLLDCLREVSAK